ncbi:MAG: hypothetical protein IT384_24190 [Deltaproteobacteria bacterium]|nr:hypothetical protein [Deltaproteobacteria bacterium]
MRWPWISLAVALFAGCTATHPTYRGPGPAPKGAADQALLRCAAAAIDLHQRIDRALAGAAPGRPFIEVAPSLRADQRSALDRVARQIERGIEEIAVEDLTAPFVLDRRLLARLAGRDRALARPGPSAPLAAVIAIHAPETSTTAVLARLDEGPTRVEIWARTSTTPLLDPARALELAEQGGERTPLRRAYPSQGLLDALSILGTPRASALAAEAEVDLRAATSTDTASLTTILARRGGLSPIEANARLSAIRREPGRSLAAFLAAEALLDIEARGASRPSGGALEARGARAREARENGAAPAAVSRPSGGALEARGGLVAAVFARGLLPPSLLAEAVSDCGDDRGRQGAARR